MIDNYLYYLSYRNLEMRGFDDCRLRVREDLRFFYFFNNERWFVLIIEFSYIFLFI